MEEKELTKPLARLVYTNLKTARTDSVSLQSVGKRFEASFEINLSLQQRKWLRYVNCMN